MAKKVEHVPQAKAHQIYKLKNGLVVPGGSTIAKIASAHQSQKFLMKWANKLGQAGYDSEKYVDKLADVGTLSHGMCEEFFRAKMEEREPSYDSIKAEFAGWVVDQAQFPFGKFLDWTVGKRIKPKLLEAELVSEIYKVGGTIDWYGEIDDVDTLLDYKTSKRFYESHFYQLAVYNTILYENGYDVSQVKALRLGRNPREGFYEKNKNTREIMLQWEIARRALEIYWLQKQERGY